MDEVRRTSFYYSKSKSSYMFRLHKAANIIPYVSENYNYKAVAIPHHHHHRLYSPGWALASS